MLYDWRKDALRAQNQTLVNQIADYLEPRQGSLVCIREIWIYALGYPHGSLPGRANSNSIAAILRTLGWEAAVSKRFPEFGVQKGFDYIGFPAITQQIFLPPPQPQYQQPYQPPQPQYQQPYQPPQPQYQPQPQPVPQQPANMAELKSLAESLVNAVNILAEIIKKGA